MADNPVMEFKGFQDYLKKRRPSLEDAFKREISGLLNGIPLRDGPSLRTTLGAGKKIRGCLSCLISDVLGGNSKPRYRGPWPWSWFRPPP